MTSPREGWHRNDRFDRPVIVPAAGTEPPAPSRAPLRVRLGQVMRLSPSSALPKACLGCGALVLVRGRPAARGSGGGWNARYCQACRTQKCRTCSRLGGQHAPGCARSQPRQCRECGAELDPRDRRSAFCEECRAEKCPECHHYGGQHRESCRWEQRSRRPGLTVYVGLVTPAYILELYEAHRPQALRIARAIVGFPENEDVVQDVFFYLLKNCGYLRAVPGPAYLFTACRNTAIRRHAYAWSRYVVAMDFPTLEVAEQMTYERRMGGRASEGDLVRLSADESPADGGVTWRS